MKKGATRCVWLIGKYAIKFPRLCSWRCFLNGLIANMTEREFDCIAPDLHAKVLYADKFGFMLVMERAEYMLPSELHEYMRQYIDKLFDRCEKAGLPIERKYADVGKFFDGYKIVDFGG